MPLVMYKNVDIAFIEIQFTNVIDLIGEFLYPLANEVAKGYSNATVRHIRVNTLG